MKKFIKQIIFFLILLTISIVAILSNADGFTDPFYLRFTSPKQSSMIIGTSRSAQGIQPKFLKDLLNKSFYNYSFTIGHSPFGNSYYQSIQKKLDRNSKNGIFIVTIDPWSLSSIKSNNKDTLKNREIGRCIENTPFVNMDPNYFYLLKNYDKQFVKLFKKDSSILFLHKDGWLELNLSNDSLSVFNRTKIKIEAYKEKLNLYEFSLNRYNNLKKTISLLKNHGKVYLVRLPISNEIMNIERDLFPDFNQVIKKAIINSDGFLDMTPRNLEFKYIDGNHLEKRSGKRVTKEIANWIKNIKQ